MHGTQVPKITILFTVCLILFNSSLFGQKKKSEEVDVSKCWDYSLGDTSGEQIAANKNGIFLALSGGKVEALSRDGKKIWSSEFGGEISSNIIVANGSLFFTTSAVSSDSTKPAGSKLRWVSNETGITNWTMALPNAARYYLSAFSGAIVVVSKNGTIESVDAKNGNVKWTRQISDGIVAEPSFVNGQVTVATAGKQIIGVLLTSGEIDTTRRVPFGITALSTGRNGELIIGDERGNVTELIGSGKPIWSFKTGGEISGILSFGGNVLVASQDNFIYFLAARNGGRVWKKRLAGRIGQTASVTDSFALISSFEERGATFVSTTDGRAAGQLVFKENESLVSPPVASNGMILLLTNSAAYAYSLNGCSAQKVKAVAGQ